MMVFGICGMVGQLIVKLMLRNVDMFDWMLFFIWGVVAICGAIKEAR